MAEPKIQLATAEQIHLIIERALDRFDQSASGELFGSMTYGEEEYLTAAIRFCADTGVDLEDASLIPSLVEAIYSLELYSGNKKDCEHIAYCIQQLLSMGGTLSEPVERLASDKRSYARLAIAKGLLPKGAREVKLLEVLSRDADLSVRKAARENLQKIKTLDWWDGIFSQDPTLGLSADEEARLNPIFQELCVVITQRAHFGEKVASLARELPDVALFDLSGLLLASEESVKEKGLWPLFSLLLERSGGAPTIRRALERWRGKPESFYRNDLHKALESAPQSAIAALCVELLESIREALRDAPTGAQDKRASNAAQLIAKYWPAGAAPVEVFEVAVSLPLKHYEERKLSQTLFALFAREDIDLMPIFECAFELRLQVEDDYHSLASTLDPILCRAPMQMFRAAAQRAISHEEAHIIVWGLEQLITRAHDPSQDPPPAVLLNSSLANPLYRTAIMQSGFLRTRALPVLRQELRERALRHPEALDVMRTIINLYGRRLPYSEKTQKEHLALQEFLGPIERQGPPTEEEFANLRIAREQQPPKDYMEWLSAFSLLPKGVWHPEDRAFFEAAFYRYREGEELLAYPLMSALLTKSLPEDLSLVNDLSLSANKDQQGAIRYLREKFMKNIGVEEEAEVEQKTPSTKLGEWMDEPDEE